MGTNYYLYDNICDHCGRSDKPLHIGKSSAGWCFSLHVIPEEELNSLEDWQERWLGKRIKDEYGRLLNFRQMYSIVTDRFWEPRERTPEFYQQNHGEPGPNGLIRHRIEGGMYQDGCIAHGEGTWDLITGEFR